MVENKEPIFIVFGHLKTINNLIHGRIAKKHQVYPALVSGATLRNHGKKVLPKSGKVAFSASDRNCRCAQCQASAITCPRTLSVSKKTFCTNMVSGESQFHVTINLCTIGFTEFGESGFNDFGQTIFFVMYFLMMPASKLKSMNSDKMAFPSTVTGISSQRVEQHHTLLKARDLFPRAPKEVRRYARAMQRSKMLKR